MINLVIGFVAGLYVALGMAIFLSITPDDELSLFASIFKSMFWLPMVILNLLAELLLGKEC